MADLDTLYREMERARRELACADMIDDFHRRASEMERWAARVAQLALEIDEAEAAAIQKLEE